MIYENKVWVNGKKIMHVIILNTSICEYLLLSLSSAEFKHMHILQQLLVCMES